MANPSLPWGWILRLTEKCFHPPHPPWSCSPPDPEEASLNLRCFLFYYTHDPLVLSMADMSQGQGWTSPLHRAVQPTAKTISKPRVSHSTDNLTGEFDPPLKPTQSPHNIKYPWCFGQFQNTGYLKLEVNFPEKQTPKKATNNSSLLNQPSTKTSTITQHCSTTHFRPWTIFSSPSYWVASVIQLF